MISIRGSVLLLALVACGSNGKDGTNGDAAVGGVDAKQFMDAPPTSTLEVTISGTATEQTTTGSSAEAGVLIEAFRNSDETTRIAFTTSDSSGNYSITIQTNGEAVDGFLKATKAGFKETYLYPPYPLTADFDEASVIMVTQATYDALSNISNGDQMEGKGLVALVVTDGSNPLSDAMVSSSPAASDVCYNQVVTGTIVAPSCDATATHTDGIAYLFNLTPGPVTVSGAHATVTLASHGLKAWADQLTTTVVVP